MILITGATGFLGSHLLQALLDRGEQVRCLYRREKQAGLSAADQDRVEWVPGDVLDVVSLEQAMQGVDRVYHCAWVVSFRPGDRAMMYQINVEGVANVVNACLGKNLRLLHVSSVAALGRARPGAPIDEQCSWEESPNNSAYARSKYEGEMEVWRGMGEELDAVIVNPSIILGPPRGPVSGSLSLISNVYDGFRWYTRGVNGFVDVRDVVRAMIMLMDSGIREERFILSGDNWSYERLLTTIARYLQVPPPSRHAAPWMGELVWRLEAVKCWLSRRQPLLTRETARTARLQVRYDSSKILRSLHGFAFTPMEDTLRFACEGFLRERGAPAAALPPAG